MDGRTGPEPRNFQVSPADHWSPPGASLVCMSQEGCYDMSSAGTEPGWGPEVGAVAGLPVLSPLRLRLGEMVRAGGLAGSSCLGLRLPGCWSGRSFCACLTHPASTPLCTHSRTWPHTRPQDPTRPRAWSGLWKEDDVPNDPSTPESARPSPPFSQ